MSTKYLQIICLLATSFLPRIQTQSMTTFWINITTKNINILSSKQLINRLKDFKLFVKLFVHHKQTLAILSMNLHTRCAFGCVVDAQRKMSRTTHGARRNQFHFHSRLICPRNFVLFPDEKPRLYCHFKIVGAIVSRVTSMLMTW